MPEQGASFIPKSGVKTVQRTRSTKRVYLLAYVSYIVFFTTLFAVAGVYLYGATVDRSLASLKDQLAVERQRFAVSDIENIRRLDERIKTATRLLEESSAPSRIFSDIEAVVASNIYFSSMKYEHLPNRQFGLELVGRASDFNPVISQRAFLRGSPILQNAEVVAYDYSVAGQDGAGVSAVSGNATLSFTFSDTRDLSLIAYRPTETESTIILSEPPAEFGGGDSDDSAPAAAVVEEVRPGSASEASGDQPQN